MTENSTATTASHVMSTAITSRSTDHFAQKPTNGGTPAMDNMRISIMNANHGLRWFKPLKSSRRSASMPARPSQITIANPPSAISA